MCNVSLLLDRYHIKWNGVALNQNRGPEIVIFGENQPWYSINCNYYSEQEGVAIFR